MGFLFKIATIEDIRELVDLRAEVLIAANCIDEDTDMSEIKNASYNYYLEVLKDNSHYAVIVYDDKKIIGTGAICFYQIMPTYMNPTGKKAYVMNMYTKKEYRRSGIASEVLNMLLFEAKRRNIKEITLEATESGKSVYLKAGFQYMESEMEYI